MPAGSFEKLNRPFVSQGRVARRKRAKIAAPARAAIHFTRVKTVLACSEFAYHGDNVGAIRLAPP
jgi:hypothetical protein